MMATPRRVTGSFPQTPATVATSRAGGGSRKSEPKAPITPTRPSRPSLPVIPENASSTAASQPVIPLAWADGPTQRIWALGVWAALIAWRMYDWVRLAEDNEASWVLFLKWIVIDLVFNFGLPELRIPWLELSQPVVMTSFLMHALVNWVLMFNIHVPWHAWLFGVLRVFYDREMAISEHTVKMSSLLQNHSLIMGKQIINILPEGSAVLNPDEIPFCLGSKQSVAKLPIHFNTSVPAEIELIRIDLDTMQQETVKVSKSEIRQIAKAIKAHGEHSSDVFMWEYAVKKTGVYRLDRVLDEYKLQIERASKDTYVVPCPSAKLVTSDSTKRCLRDISDLAVEVEGTPPLKIAYSRMINKEDRSFHLQSLQPDGFTSPLLGTLSSNLVPINEDDVSWVRPHRVRVSLNETMNTSGEWQYTIDEVRDGLGNVVMYNEQGDDADLRPKPKHLAQNFLVKERPWIQMDGCDMRHPIKVAKGKKALLPVRYNIAGRTPGDTSHSLTWEFSPIDSLTNGGDHGSEISAASYNARNSRDQPTVSTPGLYTLKSVSSDSCEGEVREPSSCMLLNPLEPTLKLHAEVIPDKCAGNSVGLRVDLDLTGTPPFLVRFDTVSSTGEVTSKTVRVAGLRSQIDLIPESRAGHYKYIFKQVDDAVYDQPLSGPGLVLEQDVKPVANAYIRRPAGSINACLEQEVEIDVDLTGDAPFTLEYELVHEGKRKSEKITGIKRDGIYKIKTAPLAKGGEYTLALTSVTDKAGCRSFLKDERIISVRPRPRAGFGTVENRHKITVVESTKIDLPLRLRGVGPWTVSYRNLNGSGTVVRKIANSDNDRLAVASRGVYEIVEVVDNQCPGIVDPKASMFEVDWFPRPEISIVPLDSISQPTKGVLVKQDVCEGDIDGFDVALKGAPPYHVRYEVRRKARQGSDAVSVKELDFAQSKNGIAMDTSMAGEYTYRFTGLSDNLYDNDRSFQPVVLQQKVNAKPSASFAKPGQAFKYCKLEQDNEERIPIVLTGTAPFYVEIEIKHQAGSQPETYRVASIDSHSHGIRIPRSYLRLGSQQIRIRKVRDARGCQQKYEGPTPSSVQVLVFDAPAIYPLEAREEYCVGDRIAYSLSGTPPFEIWYDFHGARKAKSPTTNFRRVAESPGVFTINSISDKASDCRAAVNVTKTIHPLPSVKISRGKASRVDIHEGSEVDILFEFGGTPPFEFTYTRSSNVKKGQKSVVLETRHDVSYEHTKIIKASQEGTYEVVAIKDAHCAFSTLTGEGEKEDRKALNY